LARQPPTCSECCDRLLLQTSLSCAGRMQMCLEVAQAVAALLLHCSQAVVRCHSTHTTLVSRGRAGALTFQICTWMVHTQACRYVHIRYCAPWPPTQPTHLPPNLCCPGVREGACWRRPHLQSDRPRACHQGLPCQGPGRGRGGSRRQPHVHQQRSKQQQRRWCSWQAGLGAQAPPVPQLSGCSCKPASRLQWLEGWSASGRGHDRRCAVGHWQQMESYTRLHLSVVWSFLLLLSQQ
jgi:hypothetical protein